MSTVASESAFSAGGRVVDPFRSRLDPEIVQALICTKDWNTALKKGKYLLTWNIISYFTRIISLMSIYVGGNVVGSIIADMDLESLERSLAASMITTVYCFFSGYTFIFLNSILSLITHVFKYTVQ